MKTLFGILALGLITQNALAQDKQGSRLFGGWQLDRFTITSKDGATVPFCEGAFGKIVYEKSGNVSVAINCGPNVSDDAPAKAYGGMLFYSGSFKIQGDSILHNITNSNVQSLIGKVVVRGIDTLTDTKLVLTGGLGGSGQTLRIEWSKIAVAKDLDPANEIAILTYLKLKPGTEDEFMNVFHPIIEPSLSEAGNIAWFVQQSNDDPTEIVFYTRWINQDALNFHLSSAPLAEYISKSSPLLEVAPKLVRFHPIDQKN